MSAPRRREKTRDVDTSRTAPALTTAHDVSIVAAVHDVAEHLPQFLASLDAQTGVEHSRVQVVLVDDGSSDASLSVARAWEQGTAFDVTVLTRLEGGRAAARTLGLAQATGTWVTFPDPADVLAPDYLDRVLSFVRAHPAVELVMTNAVLRDGDGTTRDSHPLRGRFGAGDRVLDLGGSPDVFCTGVRSTFFRRERIERGGVRFDPAVRPGFGSAHFAAVYLMSCPEPVAGLVASARYEERDLRGRSVPAVYADPDQYLVVPRAGYLDLLDLARERYGEVPEWIQALVVHELAGFLAAASAASGAPAPEEAVAREFLESLRDIRSRLDDHVIAGYQASALDGTARQVLRWGLLDTPWRSGCAVVEKVDDAQRLVRIATRFTGPEPAYEYVVDGVAVPPRHTKLRSLRYFGADLVHERIVWVPSGAAVRVRCEGTLVEIRDSWPGAAPTFVDPITRVRTPKARETLLGVATRQPRRAAVAARRRALRKLAASPAVRRRYGKAWVLMDRVQNADDNAEHLFTYLRDNRPEINAWFTVEAGSPDYKRLRSGPHGNRVVAHGSTQWLLLMLNCKHLVSSHIDVPVHRPPAVLELLKPGRPKWRFTFLQHGVIKDDISAWLNPKLVDLFVTSTPGEYASIVGDGSPYVYTDKETVLTGLPRFDRLQRTSEALSPQDRTLVLLAPTWREWLQAPRTSFADPRRQVRADFLETDYAKAWLGLLRSPDLAALAAEHGLRIGFLPHPNLQPLLPTLDLPAHVEALTFEGAGAQRLFASAATLVTDYSSMAFNAAYVDRPVVYFQFDRELVAAGGHLGRAGYFDYERDGFGPVTRTVEETVAAVRADVERGRTPAPEYLQRIASTFVLRDGRCCERVTAAIEALSLPAGRPARRVDLDVAEQVPTA